MKPTTAVNVRSRVAERSRPSRLVAISANGSCGVPAVVNDSRSSSTVAGDASAGAAEPRIRAACRSAILMAKRLRGRSRRGKRCAPNVRPKTADIECPGEECLIGWEIGRTRTDAACEASLVAQAEYVGGEVVDLVPA
jgi:hypothetical protein